MGAGLPVYDQRPVQHSFSPFMKLYGHSLDEHIFSFSFVFVIPMLYCFFFSMIDQSGIGYRCIWFIYTGVWFLGELANRSR